MDEFNASSGLKAICAMFLVIAAGFLVVVGLYSQEPWARTARGLVTVATPHVETAAQSTHDHVLQPVAGWVGRQAEAVGDWSVQTADNGWRWTTRNGHAGWQWAQTEAAAAWQWTQETGQGAADWAGDRYARWFPSRTPAAPEPKMAKIAPPKVLPPEPEDLPQSADQTVAVADAAPPAETAAPAEALAETPAVEPMPTKPLELARTSPKDLPLPPVVDPDPPQAAEIAKVARHLKASLTKDLYAHFELFLYVSKADRGPWSQRMFVFKKAKGGGFDLAYTWPVSTGAETVKRNPHGRLMRRDTPPGYYQLDRQRMYKKYTSHQWKQPMPYAMFFNREKRGMKTGLAIHSAHGEEIQLIGQRASAGCVRLAPANAKRLFTLIKKHYKGLVPRFAYDKRTATMSKDGLLMHDKNGKLQLTQGYKVLVFIENVGGESVVAVLF